MAKKHLAILDFGSEKITVLVGSRDVNKSINIKGIGEENYEGFMDGEFIEPKNLERAVGEAIKKAERNSNTQITELCVGVPTEFCYCLCKNVSQNFIKPKKITKKDIENIYNSFKEFKEIKTHQVINKDCVYFVLGENNKVSNPIGQVDSKITACLSYILVENSFFNIVNKALMRNNITKVRYVSSTYAQSLYLFDEEQRDRYVLLVDCGYITTSVSLTRGRGLLNLSSFSLGGGYISADLSKLLKIPFASAENLNKKIILSIEPNENDVYDLFVNGSVIPVSMRLANAIVESRIGTIAQGIQKCFSSWQYNFPDFIPIYLTGGGLSFMKGAKDLLARLLNKNVEIVSMPYSQLNKTNYSSSMAVLNYALEQEF
ncbi:MAG: hypothetical protein IKI95_07170 [Clostridia bacterium]|nr:hypothetical protein [Clostridia bacterium]